MEKHLPLLLSLDQHGGCQGGLISTLSQVFCEESDIPNLEAVIVYNLKKNLLDLSFTWIVHFFLAVRGLAIMIMVAA